MTGKLILLLFIKAAIAVLTVKHAAIIYRHGDRTPVDTYPTDPWGNESLWPVRFGELTNTGKKQHYALGQWLRRRYANFLSDKYDPKEIYIRSTDVDRTLMSAQANLAGLYPPTGMSVWDRKLLWQPIPVHTLPQDQDEILAMGKICPAYDEAFIKMIESKEYITRLKQYQDLMDYLTAYSGRKVRDYYDIMDIYSILFIESLNNFTLPRWTRAVYPNKMKEPGCYSFYTPTGTPLLAKLKVGPLFKKIVADMMNSINASKEEDTYLKMTMYSAHDLNIASLLNAMGLFDGNCPVFTATVMMELLYDNDTTTNYVVISYRNSTKIVDPFVLRIPFCGKFCPIQRFVSVYENLLSFDWDRDCKVKEPMDFRFYSKVMVILFFISGTLVCINLCFAPRTWA